MHRFFLNYVCAIWNIPAKNFILAKMLFNNYVSALLNLPFHQANVGSNLMIIQVFLTLKNDSSTAFD
jgi:hypothetical protein